MGDNDSTIADLVKRKVIEKLTLLCLPNRGEMSE